MKCGKTSLWGVRFFGGFFFNILYIFDFWFSLLFDFKSMIVLCKPRKCIYLVIYFILDINFKQKYDRFNNDRARGFCSLFALGQAD